MSCNNIHHTIIKYLLTALAALLPFAPALADVPDFTNKPDWADRFIPPKLITDVSQLTVEGGSRKGLENLLDGDDRTVWKSDPGKEAEGKGVRSLIIDISKWARQDNNIYVLMIGRESNNSSTRTQDEKGNVKANVPTKFDIRVSDKANSSKWEEFPLGEYSGQVKFLEFNDISSHEIGRKYYSIIFRGDKWRKWIRIRCASQDLADVTLDDNGDYASEDDYGFCISEIQLYDVTGSHGTDKKYEYWDALVPRYSQLDTWDDYFSRYSDYQYISTRGLIDQLNQNKDLDGWFDWSYFNADGRWTKDEDLLSKYKIQLPNWDVITPKNDPDGQVQSVHTQEKELYVLPGETIGLYPTSDMLSSYFYNGKFADDNDVDEEDEHSTWYNPYRISMTRWYDFDTNKRSKYVMSLRPDGVIKTDDGLFGGRFISNTNPDGALVMRFYRPTNEDFSGAVVAADFRNDDVVNTDKGYFIDHNNKQIIAPQYSFRALFKVGRGEDFAERISGSVANNEKYLESVTRQVEARAGVPFQIRLPFPIPTNNEDWNTSKNPSKNLWKVVENKDPILHSPYLYKDQSGNYKRAATCILEWYRVEDDGSETPVYTNNIETKGFEEGEVPHFVFGDTYSGTGQRKIYDYNGTYHTSNNTDKIDPKLILNGLDQDVEFSRTVECDEKGTQPGEYRVRLIAVDENLDVVNIYETSEPLVVMEFDVKFLSKDEAALLTEEELKDSVNIKFSNAYLDENEFISPVSGVNFDEYRFLENPDIVENPDNYILFFDKGNRLKWPLDWKESSYAFAFSYEEDFHLSYDHNSYTIANHSSVVPYKGAVEHAYGEKGLYDRLYYDTKKKNETDSEVEIEKGYYLYVNGQGDPGVMARIEIPALCQGTKLYVTGWIADFSGRETANLIVNLQAVMNDEDKTVKVLNSFTTGYVCEKGDVYDNNDGKWMQFYYSFIPDLKEHSTDVDHYEVTFENNCMNSAGADYAIDDLRVYVARPEVVAEQLRPICNGENYAPVLVKTPYDVMMANLNLDTPKEGEGEDYKFYYTFVDKAKFDKEYDAENSNYKEAFMDAVLRFPYNAEGSDEDWYGVVKFNTEYEKNLHYNRDESGSVSKGDDQAYWRTDPKDEAKYLVFNALPTDKENIAGKSFYIVLQPVEEDKNEPSEDDPMEFFDILDHCAKTDSVTFQAAGTVKIDGVAQANLNDMKLCANQSPVIQIDIYGIVDKKLVPVEKNAYLDWYEGTLEEFNAETTSDKTKTLLEALNSYRDKYPDSEDPEEPAFGSYTPEMRELIMKLTVPGEEDNGRPKLTLRKRSFAFPQVKRDEDEQTPVTVVAVPSAAYDENKNVIVCTEPLQVKLLISNDSPWLKHGFHGSGIDYPEWMSDVPLRIGLDQIKKVSASTTEADNDSFEPRLQLPIRGADAVTDGVTELEVGEDDMLYLAWTDDPEYSTLATEYASLYVGEDGDVQESSLLPVVGVVKEILAHEGGDKADKLSVVFYDTFDFKEGYTYTLQYHFQEKSEGNNESIKLNGECSGQQLLTIKVVPAYQKWSGQARGEDGEIDFTNLNWNNDDNWRRVTSEELLLISKNDKEEFISDGINSNRKSFAPLDFTKVIIGKEAIVGTQTGASEGEDAGASATASYPSLYQMSTKQVTISDGTNSETFQWSADPDADAGAIGKSTALIQFDMAAKKLIEGETDVTCRPWYGQTCDEIHFETGGRILNQHELMYNKAWVDMEIDKNIWHTLASPLQSVVAGDFYLPTKGGRQNTELFSDIIYSTADHNRFKPAVYQRAWNKSKALVHKIDGTKDDVFVKTTWSNVYNEVSESYLPGAGFSIKADLSNIEGTVPDKALFRLPKADTDYKYFENGKPSTGQTESGSSDNFSRDSIYRLNPTTETVSISAAAKSKYFLVGNPFMACLDMEIFFEENPGLNGKYWMIDGNGNRSALLVNEKFVGDLDGIIPPMGGFFVETKKEDDNITISFTPDMATLDLTQDASSETRLMSRGGSSSTSGLRISASDNGKTFSQALIRVDENADNGYKESEDVSLLYDPTLCSNPMVYTIAGNMATSINSVAGISSIEVGVIAKADAATTLRFEGDELDRGDYILFDAETGEREILSAGYSLTIEGATAGRYYIIGSSTGVDAIDALPALEMRLEGRQVILRKPGGNSPLTIAVYDTMGTLVKKASADNDQLTITLDPGLWIVAGECDGERISNKYFVR